MKKNKKNNAQLIIYLLVVLGAAATVYVLQQTTNLFSNASRFDTTNLTIKNAKDLDRVLIDLQTTDIDQIDKEIKSFDNF